MEFESVLVTGANRGIGLEFVKQLIKLTNAPTFVFATYRDEKSAQALKEVRDTSKETQVVLIELDITIKDDIESVRKVVESKVGDRGLTLLINNAGALKHQCFMDITEENMVSLFTTNTVGPVILLKEMLPLLQKSASRKTGGLNMSRAAVLNISSTVGSIGLMTEATPKQWLEIVSYRTSKAALNMAMRVAALTVKDQGILIVNMCPGWVKTDMGTQVVIITEEASVSEFMKTVSHINVQHTLLTTEDSVRAMLKTLSQINESYQGAFLDRNGKTIPF